MRQPNNYRCLTLSRSFPVAVLAGALLLAAAATRAEDGIRYVTKIDSKTGNGSTGNKMTVAGTSTIHDWALVGNLIPGYLQLPAGVVLDPEMAGLAGISGGKLDAHAEINLSVRTLHGDYDGMDAVMQQAMNAQDHPKITFILGEMTFKEPHAAGTPLAFEVKGGLIVNGVTNNIAFPVTIQTATKPRLKVTGGVSLKMSDYKVKAPVLGIGNVGITTGDEVKLSFEWLIGPATPAK